MRIAPIAIAALLAACGEGRNPPQQHLSPPADPSFTLLVSNQSFALDPVDIAVRLDGQLAVTGDFLVEGQHTWIPFDFGLVDGSHTIAVTTADADAGLDATFDVDSRRWGVLMFWYDPPGAGDPTPPQFTFTVHAEPPLFD